MIEEWRPAAGVPGFLISSLGRVRGRSGRLLRGFPDKDGYRRVSFWRDGVVRQVPVHTLVATTFIGPRPSPEHEVAHGDGSRDNNEVGNLRWALPPGQYEDRVRHGTGASGEQNPSAVLSLSAAEEIRRIYVPRSKEFNYRALASRYGVSKFAIYAIVKNKTWVNSNPKGSQA